MESADRIHEHEEALGNNFHIILSPAIVRVSLYY